MTEREMFNVFFKKKFKDLHESIYCGDLVAKQYKKAMWQTWQAATQRDGFKFVPVDNTSIMDIIHGKCPCGSSRSPIVSDKQGYNLIHCFSCGANKYIHEDY